MSAELLGRNDERLLSALEKAARDMVWTLFVRCQHDFEGHNLARIERYFVRRWLRADR